MPRPTKPTEPETSLLETSTLAVEADGLVLYRWRGSRTIPWHSIRGVRYPRAGQAELELADGKTLPLPAHGAELEALVDAIGAHCERALAELQDLPYDAEAIRHSLGIARGGAIVADTNRRVWPFALLIGGGSLLYLAGGEITTVNVVALVGSVAAMAAAARRWLNVVTVTERGISCRGLLADWSVGWADLIESSWRYDDSSKRSLRLLLSTNDDTYTVSGRSDLLQPVARTADMVVAGRTAEFRRADRDAPDTALSPAQLDDQDAERGLSQTRH